MFTILLFLMLIGSFAIIAFVFRQETLLDAAKLVEESAKILASLFVALVSLYLAHLNREFAHDREGRAAEENLFEQLQGIEFLNELSKLTLPEFENQSVSDARVIHGRRAELTEQLENARNRIETLMEGLLGCDPEVVRIVMPHLLLLQTLAGTIDRFLIDRTSARFRAIQEAWTNIVS